MREMKVRVLCSLVEKRRVWRGEPGGGRSEERKVVAWGRAAGEAVGEEAVTGAGGEELEAIIDRMRL